jgi:hypothetical protein
MSHISLVHITLSHLSKIIVIISTHLRLGLPSGPFLLTFLSIKYMSSWPPYSCYITCPFHPRLEYSDYIWPGAQITKLLAMQFSPPSRRFVLLSSKYTPQHTVLKRPQSVPPFLTADERTQVSGLIEILVTLENSLPLISSCIKL